MTLSKTALSVALVSILLSNAPAQSVCPTLRTGEISDLVEGEKSVHISGKEWKSQIITKVDHLRDTLTFIRKGSYDVTSERDIGANGEEYCTYILTAREGIKTHNREIRFILSRT